ncbi:hypothetical protein [Alteromonas lipotrueiana]|uniref:hypothetical protein n=1 Tax=Alteromonas lipotrueiana TaxID=2803815 RepID=UPI001C48C9B9|nr:hypothetical protein [Alteromonas lipotrueiana]
MQDEAKEQFIQRVNSVLPNFPDEVISQWVFRHNADFIKKFTHLNIEDWTFNLTEMSTEEIEKIELFKVTKARCLEAGKNILTNPDAKESFLGKYMLEFGTFPSPIVVFKDFYDQNDFTGESFLLPLHLAEGHRRWSFLMTMAAFRLKHFTNLQDNHKVYLVEF